MSLCKLEFFDHNMEYKHHAIADITELDDDYLASEKTEVVIDKTDQVEVNQFVWITGDFEFFGIVTEIGTEDEQTKVSFEPFISLFNRDVLVIANTGAAGWFDASDYSLEEFLAHSIYAFFAVPEPTKSGGSYSTPRGTDSYYDVRMLIPVHERLLKAIKTSPYYEGALHTSDILPSLPDAMIAYSGRTPEFKSRGAFIPIANSANFSKCSDTTNFTMELAADEFAKRRMKANLRDDILMKAIKYYGVVVQAKPDFTNKCVEVLISTPSGYTLKDFEEVGNSGGTEAEQAQATRHAAAIATKPVISADDPTVTIESFTLDSASNDANTLIVFSTANTTDTTVYYLNNDGRSPAYSTEYTTNEDGSVTRILPPKYALAHAGSNSATATAKAAKEFFKDLVWNSSVELRFTRKDPLFHPEQIPIGQLCDIWHNGKCYTSMLTARKLGDETVLTFGSVRTTLTKQMKLEKKKKK